MTTNRFFFHAASLLLAGMLFVSPAVIAQPGDVTAPMHPVVQQQPAVESAVERFYSALNTLFVGDAQPMKDAWSHADDITYMGPEGAYLKGWRDIGTMWDEVGAARLGGRVTPRDVRMLAGSDLALVTCVESGENVRDGKTETVRIRSSTVFRLESGEWKVIHHQTDLLGFLSKER